MTKSYNFLLRTCLSTCIRPPSCPNVVLWPRTGARNVAKFGGAPMPAETVPFKVADLSLADFGRREIRLAEHEMPGLMAVRAEFADFQPLAGARITGSLHMTVQTAVLIETD